MRQINRPGLLPARSHRLGGGTSPTFRPPLAPEASPGPLAKPIVIQGWPFFHPQRDLNPTSWAQNILSRAVPSRKYAERIIPRPVGEPGRALRVPTLENTVSRFWPHLGRLAKSIAGVGVHEMRRIHRPGLLPARSHRLEGGTSPPFRPPIGPRSLSWTLSETHRNPGVAIFSPHEGPEPYVLRSEQPL